jgi:hypothetical protein
MVFVNPLLYVAHLPTKQKQKLFRVSPPVYAVWMARSHTSVRLIVCSAQPLPAKATKSIDTAAKGERTGEWKEDWRYNLARVYQIWGFPAVAVFLGGAKEGFPEGGKENGNLR